MRQSQLIEKTLLRMLKNPLLGVDVEHYRAEHVGATNFTPYYQPDYLAINPGENATGVQYSPNPENPLRGVFCQAKRTPLQDKGGIYYTAQTHLFLLENPGEVFALDDRLPKRQDKFVVSGQTYYAIAPAVPCQSGSVIAAWKIELTLQRYTVTPDA
jgi:hypothetical protein